jgi:glycosyltransferase involved in cell wall biosynthesis
VTEARRPAVLIPAYNASRFLGDVLDRVLGHVSREDVWVVDDGSADDTASVAEQRGVHVVRQTPNQGKGAALRAGFDATRGRDPVITLDADGQHDPADLPRFLAATDTADLVVGARPFSSRMPPLRKFGNQISARIIGALAGQAIPDSQSGYRLHRRALLDTVVPAIQGTGGFLFETELLVRASRQGYRIGALPIATVYTDAGSHFHPATEIPRFLRLFTRLALLVAAGRAGRRSG